jgi:hypothetical protein
MMLGLGEGVFELSNLRVDVHSLRLASDAVDGMLNPPRDWNPSSAWRLTEARIDDWEVHQSEDISMVSQRVQRFG